MRPIRGFLLPLAGLILIGLVAAACGGSNETNSTDTSAPEAVDVDAPETTEAAVVPDRIVVAARGSIDASPLWVADSEGFFAAENLAIDFAPVSEEVELFYSVRDGNADVAVVSASSAIRRVTFNEDPLEFVVYLDGTQGGLKAPRGTMSLIAPQSGVQDGCDLENRRVGVDSISSLAAAAVREMVTRDGCDASLIFFFTGDSNSLLEQLAEGEIDAAALLDPYTSRALREDYRLVANLDNELCPDFGRCPISMVVAERGWAEANPEVLERFQAALDNAMFWIRQNELAYRAELVSCCALTSDDAADVLVPNFVGERRQLEGDLPRLLDILVAQNQVTSTDMVEELTR